MTQLYLKVASNEIHHIHPSSSTSFLYQLILIIIYACISFSIHFTRATLSIFIIYMINDHFITPGQYSLMLNITFIPSMFIPLIFGIWMDNLNRKYHVLRNYIILCLLGIITIGQLLFSYSASIKSFPLCLLSQVLIGLCSSSAVTANRALLMEKFDNKTFVTGCYVSVTLISKVLGQSMISPVTDLTGSYVTTMYLCSIVYIFSIGCFVYLLWGDHLQEDIVTKVLSSPKRSPNKHHSQEVSVLFRDFGMHNPETDYIASATLPKSMSYQSVNSLGFEDSPIDDDTLPKLSMLTQIVQRTLAATSAVKKSIHSLPIVFWMFILIHGIYITSFHSFCNFLPHFLITFYDMPLSQAGYVASRASFMGIFIAPVLGYFIDKIGYHVRVCIFAAVFSCVGYAALLLKSMNPVYSVLCISFGQAFIPLITLSCIAMALPQTKDGSVYGTAFGVLEIIDGAIYLVGNFVFGYLYDLSGEYIWGMGLVLGIAMLGFNLLIYIEYKYQLNYFGIKDELARADSVVDIP